MAITIIILSILVAYLFSVIAIQSKTIKRLREDISLLEYENTHLKIQVDAKNKSKARNAKGDTSTSATGSTI